jgi:uncharacterized protein involved in exopolysaccharide biosynthesis
MPMPSDPVKYQQTIQVVPSERTFHPSVQRLPRATYSHDFNLRDILTVVFKHKFKIMGVFLLALLLSPLVYYLLPVKYLATVTLMVTQGREYARPTLDNEQAPARYGLEQIIGSETAILVSNDVKDTAIKSIGAARIYPDSARAPDGMTPIEATRIEMEPDLSIEKSKTANNIIMVSYKNKNPEMAALVVNHLVDAYIEKRLQILNSEKPKQFLENKANEYKQRLRESEDKLGAFRQQHQVFALPEQKQMFIQQRSNLDIAIKAAQAQNKELQQKMSSLGNQMQQIPKNLPAASVVQTPNDAEGQLLVLQRKEQELLTKYREDTPFVENVRNEIRLVQNFIAKQKQEPGGRMVNDLHQTLQKDFITIKADLSATEAGITELKHQLREVDRDTQNIDLLEKNFRELQRERDANEKSYQVYAQKLEETRISVELDQKVLGSVRVIEKAETPLISESKAKKRGLGFFLALGAVLGLGGGLGLAFLLEFNRQGMGTPQKAEKVLDLPVLSAFSYQK